jgi:hypothetical protein
LGLGPSAENRSWFRFLRRGVYRGDSMDEEVLFGRVFVVSFQLL